MCVLVSLELEHFSHWLGAKEKKNALVAQKSCSYFEFCSFFFIPRYDTPVLVRCWSCVPIEILVFRCGEGELAMALKDTSSLVLFFFVSCRSALRRGTQRHI